MKIIHVHQRLVAVSIYASKKQRLGIVVAKLWPAQEFSMLQISEFWIP
jgi:hypothetical protein